MPIVRKAPALGEVAAGRHHVRQPFASANGKNRNRLETPAHCTGPPSGIPEGTIHAKSLTLSRYRPVGRNGICRLRPIRRTAEGRGPQHRARAWCFRRSDQLAAGRRYPREERLQRHAGGKSADLAGGRCRCHQTGAGEAGRQDRSGRPFLGWHRHHRGRQRSQGLGAGLRLRIRARGRRIPGVAGQKRSADRRRQRDPSRRQGQSIPKYFRRPSRPICRRRLPPIWPKPSFRSTTSRSRRRSISPPGATSRTFM